VSPIWPILTKMARTFIDPRDEAPALRRAAILLGRVRQDGGARDSDLETLQAGVDAMRRAAASGRTIHHSAIDRLATVLGRISSSSSERDRSVYGLLRSNALLESCELVERLTRRRDAPADVPSERRVFEVRASEERRAPLAVLGESRPSPMR
jgi:hypothetical protein